MSEIDKLPKFNLEDKIVCKSTCVQRTGSNKAVRGTIEEIRSQVLRDGFYGNTKSYIHYYTIVCNKTREKLVVSERFWNLSLVHSKKRK